MKLIMDWAIAVTEAGFWGLLVWSWQASVVIAGVWLGLKVSRLQSPALRHQIWLCCLVAVAVLPIWSRLVEVLPLPRPTSEALINVAAVPETIAGRKIAQPVPAISPQAGTFEASKASKASGSIFALSDTGTPNLKAPSAGTPSAGTPAFWVATRRLLFIAWITGALVVLLQLVSQARHLRRLRLEARPVTWEELNGDEGRHVLGGIGRASISSHALVNSPFLVGLWRPSIIVPADLPLWTTVTERRAMLRHEIAHLTRRDHYVHLFVKLLRIVFYFHPLVIFVCRQLEIEREIACDDRVIEEGTPAEVYAEGLLKAAGRGLMRRRLQLLGVISSKQVLEKRIGMIMDQNRVRDAINHRRKLALSIALIALVVWGLAPARLATAGSRDPHGNSELGSVVAELTLTAEQKEQLRQASGVLSTGLPRMVRTSGEEYDELYRRFSGVVMTWDRKYAGPPNGPFVMGAVKNTSPFSSRLLFKSTGFDRAVTISLTEEQRQQFTRIFNRPVTDLGFNPSPEAVSIFPGERGYQGAVEKLKNTLRPDAYYIRFYAIPDDDMKVEVEAHYRTHKLLGRYWHVHNLWSLFYPKIYPQPQDRPEVPWPKNVN